MMENKTIAACTDAIRLNPHDAAAYYQRGDAYYDINNYDAAITDFTQAIRLNPNYDKAYHLRGVSYFIKDDYDAAITDFTEAVRLDPNNADYKDILAEALRKKEGD
ncbi:MAG: tetratricopeptide repeat protein [Treponematales bacterium]